MSALEGASRYLNNLLLSRGLLPNGKPIDFAHPTCDGSSDATMSTVINLVHNLVLRKDRDSEHQESMAASIKSLRAADAQSMLDLQQLKDKTQRLQSEAVSTQAQERSTRGMLKKIEQQVKELKEQNMKLKSMLDQVRAKCISDVKKRDTEIEKLKGHIIGLQRAKRDASGMKINTLSLHAPCVGTERRGTHEVNSTGWSLEKETNDFLAALVNETSAENVALRQIVGETIDTLREMTGLEEILSAVDDDDGIGIPGQYRKIRQSSAGTLVPVEVLTQQLEEILQHCKTILKDPSFVPIEEVQVRDDEIAKLKAGWEKMADRWKEAVTMMSQWKQRMLQEGRAVDVGDFSDLSFGRSIATRPDGQPILGRDDALSSIFEESIVDADSSERTTESKDSDSNLEHKPEPELDLVDNRLASSPAKRGVKLPRLARPLNNANGNSRNQSHISTHSKIFRSSSDTENVIAEIDQSGDSSESLTVSQKLKMIEAEASRAKERQLQSATRKRKVTTDTIPSRKSGRRRSTLSPEELASLMAVR